MKITWLGQAGLLFEENNFTVLVDPYLSDSVSKVNPKNKRRVAVNDKFFSLNPDVLICTHDHLDHTDPETLKLFLEKNEGIEILAPFSAWNTIRKIGGNHNFVNFNRHTRYSLRDFTFTAVKAEHSDAYAIGVLIEHKGKCFYITGDTLYNYDIFSDLPQKIDVVFLPVNGAGNNMNMTDAALFCERVAPKYAVPMHCGLFDNIDMNTFSYDKKVVPKIYEEIVFPEIF